jgi:hypothetical protein
MPLSWFQDNAYPGQMASSWVGGDGNPATVSVSHGIVIINPNVSLVNGVTSYDLILHELLHIVTQNIDASATDNLEALFGIPNGDSTNSQNVADASSALAKLLSANGCH